MPRAAASIEPSRTDAVQTVAAPRSRFTGKRVHMIGIGGCGMSGLARLLASHGAICTGSDSTPSNVTASLIEGGIDVNHDQSRGFIPDGCDLIVASAAIKPDHPEVLAAAERDIAVITYAEMLGKVQSERTGISIAGTHGKSTTTAMLAHVLIECNLDPSFIIGANCAQIGGGSRTGAAVIPNSNLTGAELPAQAGSTLRGSAAQYHGTQFDASMPSCLDASPKPGIFLAEACEFNRSFHHHRPTIALINNIEEDHLDIYGSLDNVVKAFAEFARLVPPADEGGRLLIAHEGAHRREVTAGLPCAIETFGYSPAADYQVVADPAVQRVGLLRDGHWLAQWTNAMPGEHNALNSAAAAILAHYLGADWEAIADALSSFEGIERRMQRLGVKRLAGGGEVVVYDDYGHHPTEIEKTLKALRAAEFGTHRGARGERGKGNSDSFSAVSATSAANSPGRLICVFQPHQHSRTRFLLEEFAQSFSSADIVIVPHIYFVRDSEIEKTKVSAADLVDRLRQRGITAMHLYPFEAIVEQLEVICRPGDLVVIMGAGPVWKVGKQFLGALTSAA